MIRARAGGDRLKKVDSLQNNQGYVPGARMSLHPERNGRMKQKRWDKNLNRDNEGLIAQLGGDES